MATLPGNRKATGAAGYPLSVNPLPITMYSDGFIDPNTWPPGFNHSTLGIFNSGSINYKDTSIPQSGHTFDLKISVSATTWIQATNFPFPFNGGNNGFDISQYTKLQFDALSSATASIGNIFAFYPRAQRVNDSVISTKISVGSTYFGNLPLSTWNQGLVVPLCLIGMLGYTNYYQFAIQNSSGSLLLDNVKFIPGNLSWIYTGNPFVNGLENGWVDASSGTTVNYSFQPQTLGANFISIGTPPASPTFQGNISQTTLGAASVQGGNILPGMSLFGNGVISGTKILSGSGSIWNIDTNNGTIGTESMSAAFPQESMLEIQMSGAGTWRANFPGGFNVSLFTQFTFAAMPAAAGYSYVVSIYDTSGNYIGSVSAGTFTPNDFGVQTSSNNPALHTVYSIPLTAFGTLPQNIGGVSIVTSQGGLLGSIGFWS